MTTEEFLASIDWSLLRQQKLALLNAVEAIEGVVNLIDSIQDHAVDEIGIFADDVFLSEEAQ